MGVAWVLKTVSLHFLSLCAALVTSFPEKYADTGNHERVAFYSVLNLVNVRLHYEPIYRVRKSRCDIVVKFYVNYKYYTTILYSTIQS